MESDWITGPAVAWKVAMAYGKSHSLPWLEGRVRARRAEASDLRPGDVGRVTCPPQELDGVRSTVYWERSTVDLTSRADQCVLELWVARVLKGTLCAQERPPQTIPNATLVTTPSAEVPFTPRAYLSRAGYQEVNPNSEVTAVTG